MSRSKILRATLPSFSLVLGCGHKLSICENKENEVNRGKLWQRAGLESAVGNTPLIYLKSLSEQTGCEIYGKAEFLNPTGSVKDRAVKMIIEDAEREGILMPGGSIVEATGGNTGIALAQLAAAKGYKVVLTMPNIIATEKIDYQKRFGATVLLQPLVPFSDPENFVQRAASYAKETGALFTNQFENLANFEAHYTGTGPEIWTQLGGKIDGFVASSGTGGPIAGISAYLKDKNPHTQCYLIDPVGSVLFNYVTCGMIEATPGVSQIEGIGIGRITANFKKAILDGAFCGSDQEAVAMVYYLMRNDGVFVGPSAALNVVGAVKLARKLGPGHTVVTILCDGGERYVSKIFNPAWLDSMSLTPTYTGKSLNFVT